MLTAGILIRMADVTRDDVMRLAKLAQLQLSDGEIDQFSKELTEILHYVEQLKNVDVKGLEPTNQVTGLTNITRSDTIKGYGYDPLDLLANVPSVEQQQIRVKRMVG